MRTITTGPAFHEANSLDIASSARRTLDLLSYPGEGESSPTSVAIENSPIIETIATVEPDTGPSRTPRFGIGMLASLILPTLGSCDQDADKTIPQMSEPPHREVPLEATPHVSPLQEDVRFPTVEAVTSENLEIIDNDPARTAWDLYGEVKFTLPEYEKFGGICHQALLKSCTIEIICFTPFNSSLSNIPLNEPENREVREGYSQLLAQLRGAAIEARFDPALTKIHPFLGNLIEHTATIAWMVDNGTLHGDRVLSGSNNGGTFPSTMKELSRLQASLETVVYALTHD